MVFWARGGKRNNFPELEEMLGKFVLSDNAIGLAPFLENHPRAVEWEAHYGSNSETFLHKAVHKEKYNAARTLLEYGAATDTLGIGGGTLVETAMNLVFANSRGKIENEMRMADLLISYGADLEQRNASNRTVLQQACMMGKAQAAEFLVARGADQHATGHAPGFSLLREAVSGYGDRTAIIEYVLSLKHDVNAENAEGQTALFFVQDAKAAAMLIAAGADPNHKSHDGRRPWDLRIDETLGDFIKAKADEAKTGPRLPQVRTAAGAVFGPANTNGAEEALRAPVQNMATST